MKISLAKSAGFCFGVKRAIDIAFNTAKSNTEVYMLGDIVHNEDVINDVRGAGIKKLKRLGKGKGKTLLLCAHGTGCNVIKKAARLGYKIVDATCPMVKEIHKIAKNMEAKGYTIIIIGDKKHAEVLGIIGQLKDKAIVIESLANIPFKLLKAAKKYAVVVQSTQDIEKAKNIADKLRPVVKKLAFFNTVCGPTRIKQAEIKKMPAENDCMVIIGSKASANTKRLYEISKAINKRSFWISSKNDLARRWFVGAERIGITAGASTPDYTIKEIVRKIGSELFFMTFNPKK